MPTLEELKRENKRLRNIQKSIKEMQNIQDERIKLSKENRAMSRQIKHKGALKFGKYVEKGFVKTGKGLAIAGKGAFKGLQKYANYLEQQERKQRALNRNLKTTRKKIRKIKKK